MKKDRFTISTCLIYIRIYIFNIYWLILLSIVVNVNCTGLKNITREDPLYKGADINYIGDVNPEMEVKGELKEVNKPKPNGKFLWMRPGPAIYNMVGELKKEKGFKFWLKTKVGKPPVLASMAYPENVTKIMTNRLFNMGYFNSKIDFESDTSGKLMKIEYDVNLNTPHKIEAINYHIGDGVLENEVMELDKSSLLKIGDTYNLEVIKTERERIEFALKDSGYYYFNRDFLYFQADTLKENDHVNLKLNIKPNLPFETKQKIRLNNIYILDDYRINDYAPDTVLMKGYYYISNRHIFRPEIILSHVHLRPNELYSRKLQYRTINQLMNLGVYKYVNTIFNRDSISNSLNTTILMTPLKRTSISAEVNAVVRTTNYIGPGVRLTWRHRNLFSGAEELYINLYGSFEVQIGGDSLNTAIETGIEIGLDIPRPLMFKRLTLNKEFIPRTKISTGFTYYRRVELYTMNTFFITYGYNWKKNRKVSHRLNIADISFSDVSDQTEAFKEYLENNPTVAVSFEDQFIIGGNYMYSYDDLSNPNKTHTTYFNGLFDVSGNIAYVIHRAITEEPPTFEEPYTLFGVPFSQYVKLTPEFRYYFKLNNRNVLATRALVGVGIPIGNSRVLPYIKQYYSGGTNSVRAFLARTIGPGSYYADIDNLNIDQTGDIKLEVNAEYRFSFSRRLKGALFLDVGNVWLSNEDPSRPGGEFNFNTFYKQFGIGTGLGFRIDLEVFVFRIDLAWPLHVPYLEENNGWVIDDINFFSKDWRRQNLVWNFAIGYPF